MSRLVVPLLVALSLANSGCCYTGNVWGNWDFFANGIRNLSSEPVRANDHMILAFRIKGWAAKAWQEVKMHAPEHPYSLDYEKGFLEGFRDYVESGGSGAPPAVPTLCYRLSWYRNPPGQQAITDWYEGFRRGALVAKESGYREIILVPISSTPPAYIKRLDTANVGPVEPGP